MAGVIGFAEGVSFDAERSNWDGSGPRPLRWAAWYPTIDKAKAVPLSSGSRFLHEPVARDAAAHADAGKYPVVLLSHGTGGVAEGLEWLGRRLAQAGFVALGVNHHGNTHSEPHRAEGFLCLWERARDLSVLLEHPDWRGRLSVQLQRRAHVAGFSAGAYTAMLTVGARVSHSQFEDANPIKSPTRGPPAFPNLADKLPDLLERSPLFRQSWERRTASYADERFLSALVIAPGRSVLGFSPESLSKITRPVSIIAGEADIVAPAVECRCGYMANCQGASWRSLVMVLVTTRSCPSQHPLVFLSFLRSLLMTHAWTGGRSTIPSQEKRSQFLNGGTSTASWYCMRSVTLVMSAANSSETQGAAPV
jgi:predicted dienelactone hydrolase